MADKPKQPMPEDYFPKTPLTGFMMYFENRRPFDMLSGDEVKTLMIRLYDYAEKYAHSFIPSLRPDTDGLSQFAAYALEVMSEAAKRSIDNARQTSWNRSGANGGGRPKQT